MEESHGDAGEEPPCGGGMGVVGPGGAGRDALGLEKGVRDGAERPQVIGPRRKKVPPLPSQ